MNTFDPEKQGYATRTCLSPTCGKIFPADEGCYMPGHENAPSVVKLRGVSSIGCYTITYYTHGGEALCRGCAEETWIKQRTEPHDVRPSDRLMGADVHWEGPPEYCGMCEVEMPSEYGDPDEEETDGDL